MKMKNLILLICFVLPIISAPDASATFKLFPGDATGEVIDNGPLDVDPRVGYIEISSTNPITVTMLGGCTFSGTGRHETGPTSDRIIITGPTGVSGRITPPTGYLGGPITPSTPIAEASYNFGMGGGGINLALIGGTCDAVGGAKLAGGEWLQLCSVGTTFFDGDPTSPVAVWIAPPGTAGLGSVPMSGYDKHNGWYGGGSGIHYAYASFCLGGASEVLVFPDSLEGELLLPEPATLSLLAMGGLALLRRRRGKTD